MKNELLDKIRTLEAIHKKTCSKKIYQQLLQERKALETIEISAVQKHLNFLKQRTWYKSPKSMRYLAWRLKKKTHDRAVAALKTETGQMVTNPVTISELFAKFYRELYRSRSPHQPSILAYLKKTDFLQNLALDHRDLLDQPITASEISEAIKRLQTGKSPGRDSFPAELYKSLSSILTPILIDVFNFVLDTGLLPPSWSESKIVVILKPGRDSLQPSSYRPISLLNQDYKLFTAILVNRLNRFIFNYIHPDQTGFIPKRDISDNIQKTLNILFPPKTHNVQLLLQSLDIYLFYL